MKRYTDEELLSFINQNERKIKHIVEELIFEKTMNKQLDNNSKMFIKENYLIIKECANRAKKYKDTDNNNSGYENSLFIVKHSDFLKKLNKFLLKLNDIKNTLELKHEIKFYYKSVNYSFAKDLNYEWLCKNKEEIQETAEKGFLLLSNNEDYFEYTDAMYIVNNFKEFDSEKVFKSNIRKCYKELIDSSSSLSNSNNKVFDIVSEQARAFCKIYLEDILKYAKKGFTAKENNLDYSNYLEAMFLVNHSLKLFDLDIFFKNIKNYYHNKNLIEDDFNAVLFVNNYKNKIIKLSEYAQMLKTDNPEKIKYQYVIKTTKENTNFNTLDNVLKQYKLYIEKRFINIENQIILSKEYKDQPLYKTIIHKKEIIHNMALEGNKLKSRGLEYNYYEDAMWLEDNCFILLPIEKKIHVLSEALKNNGLTYSIKIAIKAHKDIIIDLANKGEFLKKNNLDYSNCEDAIYITENYHIFETTLTKLKQILTECNEHGVVKQFLYNEDNDKVLNPLSTWLTANKFRIINLAFEAYYRNEEILTEEEIIAIQLMDKTSFINCEDRAIVVRNFAEDPFINSLNKTRVKENIK